MKRLLPLIFALVTLTSPAWGGGLLIGSGVGGSCTYNQVFSYEVSTTSYLPLSYNYFSGSFTTTGAYNGVVRVGIYLKRTGTPPKSVHLYLYSDNAAKPQTQLASSTGWSATYNGESTTGDLPAANVSTTGAWYYFDIPTLNLQNATRYHIVLPKDYEDSSNNIGVLLKDNGTPTEVTNYGSALPPTTNYDTSKNMLVRIISCN